MAQYDYLIVGAGLFGCVFAREASDAGKRCLGFVSSGLRQNAALQNLMKVMESEGMFLTLSEIITKENDAYTMAKHLKLERN